MTTDELQVLAAGRRMGTLTRDRVRDKLRFEYDRTWSTAASSFPLSLSMPLVASRHPDDVVEPFLWGLLPDNEGVLRRWGERFGVSPRHAFKLIAHVGEDCAGAVQFVTPERAAALLTSRQAASVQWLDDGQLAARMQLLLEDHSAARLGTDRGRFSLAGAQPKTALIHDPARDRWGVPSGQTPTTHILKPATGQFAGYGENEHFCLALARTLGMPAADSTIRRFGDITVFVTERYDRIRIGRRLMRVHQEDVCQALGRMPHAKYQNEGGPAPAEILALIRAHSTARAEDELRFLDALLLNWLMLGTDAHAKNYSFLIGAAGAVRLAPLYDLASALPYSHQLPLRRAALAMKVGGKYRVQDIGGSEWRQAANEWRIPEDRLRERMARLTAALPNAARMVAEQMRSEGIDHPVLESLAAGLSERAARAQRLIDRPWR